MGAAAVLHADVESAKGRIWGPFIRECKPGRGWRTLPTAPFSWCAPCLQAISHFQVPPAKESGQGLSSLSGFSPAPGIDRRYPLPTPPPAFPWKLLSRLTTPISSVTCLSLALHVISVISLPLWSLSRTVLFSPQLSRRSLDQDVTLLGISLTLPANRLCLLSLLSSPHIPSCFSQPLFSRRDFWPPFLN